MADAADLLANNARRRARVVRGQPGNQGDGEEEPAPEFSLLKMYLRITALWYPSKAAVEEEAIWKEVVKTFAQLIILGGLIFNYCYELGAFHSHTLVEKQYNENVTTIKNIMWFSRMPVMYVFVMFYFPKRHLESLLKEVKLTSQCWRKAKKAIYKSFFAVVVFAFLFPLSSKVVQMTLHGPEETQTFKPKEICMSLVFSALSRFFSLPIIFVFILVVCIISSDIRLFKEQVQKWSGTKEEARNRFIDIKLVIRNTQKAFQPFLTTQLVFLCVLLLPSIFSVAERFQTEATNKDTPTDAMNIQEASRSGVDTEHAIFANSTARRLMRLKGDKTVVIDRPRPSSKRMNRSLQGWSQEPTEHTEHQTTSKGGIIKVVCSCLSDFLEMFIVYSFPLVLLARLHNKMTSLPEVVQNLKFSEQTENGYLFRERKVLKEMLKELSSGKGIQILRMDLTGVKAVFITLLAPFLTTTYKLLFLDIQPNS
ncbi:uncharacterized protein LOC141879040 [Acropora palmata]|uniref:uncharacterized protein LOC141879040 n=1 Tax=Acropora palmata TaxID=6131 RepID=UPI003DA01DEF